MNFEQNDQFFLMRDKINYWSLILDILGFEMIDMSSLNNHILFVQLFEKKSNASQILEVID